MKLRNALLATSLAATPLTAYAQVVYGPYVSAGAGLSYEQQENVTSLSPTTDLQTEGRAQLDLGYTGEVSAGYGFGDGIRAEIEGTYLNNHFHKYSQSQVLSTGGTSSFSSAANGIEQKYGALLNAYYDLNLGTDSFGFYPYIGAGVGLLHVTDDPSYSDAGVLTQVTGEDKKLVLAYQGIVGVAYPIAGIPGLSLTAEYRGLDSGESRAYATYTGGARVQDEKFGNTWNHSFLLGVRYAFGVAAPAPVAAAPPPAPPPAATPAPAPARTYLVFFDWDKYNLTDKARAIIADAAQASTQVQTTRIQVNGYTDLSGTPRYNYGLSVRRAKAVQAELIRLGVPANEISIMGYGENDPLVPTAPGVREPQNRRVEIILK